MHWHWKQRPFLNPEALAKAKDDTAVQVWARENGLPNLEGV